MIQIVRDDSYWVRHNIIEHHYLHKWPSPLSLPFSYRITVNGNHAAPDRRPFGIIVLKKLQHSRQKGVFGYAGLPTAWQLLDLARVWIHPSLQKQHHSGHSMSVFSQAVSRLWQPVGKPHERICRVQRDWLAHHPPVFPDLPYHIRLIVSYCQLEYHDGIAYKASGFVEHGLSSDREKKIFIKRLPMPRCKYFPNQYQLKLPLPGCGQPNTGA